MADDLDSSSEDEREIELSSMTAIYPELVRSTTDRFTASIDIAVTPIKAPIVSFVGSERLQSSTEEKGVILPLSEHSLSHLPSLNLDIYLPASYPREQPPDFSLSVVHPWISRMSLASLESRAKELWEDIGRDQVIFSYVDFLQQEAEHCFDATDSDGRLVLPKELEAPLLDFEISTSRAKFNASTYDCGICLEPKRGTVCHRMLLCSHVFCIKCLQDFYNACITEGDIHSVKCLDPSCGKEAPVDTIRGKRRPRKPDHRLNPSELLEMKIDHDMVKRYVDLKRKFELEANRNTIYCPRKWCQGPAKYEKPKRGKDTSNAGNESESEDEEAPAWKNGDPPENIPPPSQRLAVCENCSYAFCRVCQAGWHGELATCFPRNQRELNEEEKASEDYMLKFSSLCPTCNARCQKSMGCNHMVCFNCRTHFCYLCSAWLEEGDPYKHYNQPFRGCYMRLWDLEAGDGLDADLADHEIQLGAEVVGQIPAPGEAVVRPQQERPDPPHNRRVRQREEGRPAQPFPVPERAAGPRDQGIRGIRRFLEMAQNDEEDEWNSDEFDDDEDPEENWIIPIR